MSLAAGTRLGPYEITSPLGAGGMGEVWSAIDTRLDRCVAIKVLPADFAADRERVARFAREAKLLASLHHPGIATIHAFEEVDGRRLLVMELAEGEGLDERMARGPIPLEDAVPIARQIAEALEQAHEQGIVHRDLKPANVKVGADGRVKVLDFGLAKAMAPEPSGASGSPLSQSPTIEASPTVAGVILGTAPYMSPEQARGRPVDRRADIWAFGVVLWEMLTGQRLFTGESVSDVFANVLRQPIDVEALPRETPASVRRLVKRCLERDPRKRLRDIGEARVALEDVGAAETEAGAAQSAPRVSRARIAAIAVTAGALGALAAWLVRPAPSRAPVRSVSFPVERLVARPFVSPDGTRVLYIADQRLRVQSLTDPLAAPLDLTPVILAPDVSRLAFWSHDGANVAVAREHKLWRIPASGGTASVICEIPESGEILGGDWSADDEIVFAAWRGSLYRVPGGGGRPEEILRRDPKSEVDFHSPRLLPEKRGVLFLAHHPDEEPHGVEVLADGRRTTVLDDGAPIGYVVSAPGRLVFDRSGKEGIWEVPFSLSRRMATGRPRLVLADGTCPSVASDGTLVFVRGGAAPMRELVWVKADGSVQARIGPPARAPNGPALSPDEKRIAVTYGADEHLDLWTIDIDRGAPSRLTATREEDEQFPSWSPSGDRILFGQAKSLRSILRSIDASGAAEARDVAKDFKAVRGVLEPDGRHLVYAADEGGGRTGIFRVAVDAELRPAGPSARLPGSSTWWSRFAVAPQGDLLTYVGEGERLEIFVLQLGGTARWQVSNGGGDQPCWSRKGDRLFYIAGDDMMEVEVRRRASLSLGTPRRLFSLSEQRLQAGAGFDVASDGRFLMVRDSEAKRIVVVVNGTRLLERPGR
jgi:dipeptidyl aminopeptidase/acylaminoacyl peptidase